MKNIIGLSSFLVIFLVQVFSHSTAQGQQHQMTLSQAWTDGNNSFTLYRWLGVEDNEEIYSSPVYQKLTRIPLISTTLIS